MCFLLVGPLIKLRPGALVNTLIIVTIELSIAKVIRIFNFNYMLVPGVTYSTAATSYEESGVGTRFCSKAGSGCSNL